MRIVPVVDGTNISPCSTRNLLGAILLESFFALPYVPKSDLLFLF